MSVSVIVAAAENGVIGQDGDLPWRLPRDLKEFKKRTWGHTLVMGRRTWESIGRALPGRRSIVLSRQEGFEPEGGEAAASLEEALEMTDGEEAFIIGGAEVYRLALPRAQRLYLTRVHAEVDGDTRLPEIDWTRWKKLEERRFEADDRHAYPHTFEVYERDEG